MKEKLFDYFLQQKESIENGEINSLKIMREIKEISDFLTEIRDEILDPAIRQLENDLNGAKTYKLDGADYSISQSGVYQYGHAENWNIIKNNLKTCQDNMQIAQKKGQVYIDSETGEIFEPAIYTQNKKSISIKISKK